MTNNTPQNNGDPIENAIRKFHWDNYGMDDVDYALNADPDAQEWVPALATKIRTAIAAQSVDPAPALPQRIALGVSQGIGDPIRAFDMLRQVFASQEAFQRLLGHDYSAMDTPALVEYIKNQVLALLDEGHEALHEVSWKPWAKDTFVHREALAGELVDILCFLVNLALAAGLSPDDFYRLHQEKALRNIKRQEQAGGYSVLEGKCPGCGRAIDDLRAKNLPVGNFGGVDYCSHECIQKKNPHLVAGQGVPFHTTENSES